MHLWLQLAVLGMLPVLSWPVRAGVEGVAFLLQDKHLVCAAEYVLASGTLSLDMDWAQLSAAGLRWLCNELLSHHHVAMHTSSPPFGGGMVACMGVSLDCFGVAWWHA